MARSLQSTTLYLRGIPKELVRELKAQAARQGLTLTAVAIEALARTVGTEPSGKLKSLEADMAWYNAHRRHLARRYRGEYLAIVDGRVVDHDLDFGVLAGRVFERVGVRPVFMPQCVPTDQAVHLRSPRLTQA